MAKKINPGKNPVTDPNAAKEVATHALKKIIAVLPQGYTATNKQAVMKVLNPNPYGESPVWTSWATDGNGQRFLAILKERDNENNNIMRSVKLIPEEEAHYKNV